MQIHRFPILLFVALILSPGMASAGMPLEMSVKCPINGKSFTFVSTGSYSTWGSRPDGKPYGSWMFPLELPVCPGNGLVMYRDFTREEVRQLRSLVGSADYQLLLRRDRPHYRAAWLERRLVPQSKDANWILLQATWEADDDPLLRARYQAEFVSAVDATRTPTELDAEWLTMQLRVANAERELGLFDAAQSRLARLDFTAAGENRQGIEEFAKKLAAVAGRADASSEPLELIPRRMAAFACVDGKLPNGQTPSVELCKAEPLASEVAKVKAARSQR